MRMAVINSFDDLVNEALYEVRRKFFLDFSEIFL